MKGFARNLDSVGRIVIPKEMLMANNLSAGSLLYIKVTPEGILLTPADEMCAVCGSTADVLDITGINICRSCAQKIFDKGGLL